jgi:hypothetical protein
MQVPDDGGTEQEFFMCPQCKAFNDAPLAFFVGGQLVCEVCGFGHEDISTGLRM